MSIVEGEDRGPTKSIPTMSKGNFAYMGCSAGTPVVSVWFIFWQTLQVTNSFTLKSPCSTTTHYYYYRMHHIRNRQRTSTVISTNGSLVPSPTSGRHSGRCGRLIWDTELDLPGCWTLRRQDGRTNQARPTPTDGSPANPANSGDNE